jgi:integrase
MVLRKRKLPSGKTTFFLDDLHAGERIRETLGVVLLKGADPMTAKNVTRLAEQLFYKRQAEILAARKGLVKDENPRLVDYARRLAEGRHTSDHVVKLLPYLERHFGAVEIKAVSYRDCDAFQAFLGREPMIAPKRSQTKAKAEGKASEARPRIMAAKTIKHYFNALAFVLNEAVRERMIEKNPAEEVRRVKVPEKVVVSLTMEELQKLWDTPAGRPYAETIKTAFFFSVNTGLRFGDIKALRWKDLQTAGSEWKIIKAQNKTGGVITTPLISTARSLILPLFDPNPEAAVFKMLQTKEDYTKHVRAWMDRAGVRKDASMHTARHTFGTNAASLGANSLQIQHLMGHTTGKMTAHYTQTAGAGAREMLEKLPKMEDKS